MPDSYDPDVVHPYDPDVSHGYLVAVLMAHGGELDIDPEYFTPEVLGTPDGRLHGVLLGPSADGKKIRLSVSVNPHRDPAEEPAEG